MNAPLWLVWLLVGCGAQSISLGDKTANDDTGPSGTGDDTAGDTDPVPERFSGTFAGAADIGRPFYCEGSFTLALAADGAWSGDGQCLDTDGVGFTGPLDGQSAGKLLSGRFAYTGLGFTGEAAVELTRTGPDLAGTVQDQDDGIAISLIVEGVRDAR
ncbi:MAG: hypothetical protein Q8P18_01790 [Pseudomonadota bacterium]|nr:hypothetical protein [Pseudomonadota bacterium]